MIERSWDTSPGICASGDGRASGRGDAFDENGTTSGEVAFNGGVGERVIGTSHNGRSSDVANLIDWLTSGSGSNGVLSTGTSKIDGSTSSGAADAWSGVMSEEALVFGERVNYRRVSAGNAFLLV